MEMQQKKQRDEVAGTGLLATRLLSRQTVDLSGWYGEPVSKEMAQTLEAITQSELRIRLCEGGTCFQLHVLVLICHYWTGSSIELEYEQLAASASNDRERALLELVYGQLLISCKYQHAVQHLIKGFSLAAEHLDSSDYFHLVKQHELLESLPVASKPSPPIALESLLTEARVIRQLQAGAGRRYGNTRHDTLG